ncbi:MAG: ATP-dependent DNA helicase, partial [Lachnospiraceae bacterium]|nr:ATP-dependent DNA helicase [Lachnospiraceae bacterium]
MTDSMISQIHISVRSLVEFIMRSGNIDNRRKASSGPEVMLEGANIHRMIQRRMGAGYHAEVYLSCIIERADARIVLDGRADGIIIPQSHADIDISFLEDSQNITADLDMSSDDPATFDVSDLTPALSYMEDTQDLKGLVVIDEIKTTYRDLEKIKAPENVHLAQAKCYAYIVAAFAHLPAVGVRMTYCNTETKEIRYFDSVYSADEITAWFKTLMKAYIRWADFETGWKKIRNMSIETMEFPYEYRNGQRELIAQVYSSIVRKERLFVMAPTGVGKTIANIYPSLKAVAAGKADKIFYLTAKTITRTVAEDCLNVLRHRGDKETDSSAAPDKLRLKSVTLTAKEKICPLEKCECNPEACPFAKGHFDRINDAMYDLLTNEDDFSRENIVKYSEKHMVCPFEFSLDMSLFSDIVICDYNYVFDPNVYLRRFFAEGASGDYLFLIDEAHNLTERAMKMYSAELVKEDILDLKRLVSDIDPRLARSLDGCNRQMLSLKRECEDVKVVESFDPFVNQLLRLNGRLEQFLDDREHFEHSEEVLDFYFNLRHFLNIYENMNQKDYVLYTKHEDGGNFGAHLMCANPAKRVRACTDKAGFTVFFSATLLPIDYYRMMLGADASDPAVYARSVFDQARRALLVARDVTSKYTRRSDSEYDRMASYISAVSSAKAGNYMVFFPSFAMLSSVYEIFMSRYYDPQLQEVAVQEPQMSESEREEFLSRFSSGYGDRNLDSALGPVRQGAGRSNSPRRSLKSLASAELALRHPCGHPRHNTLLGFCVLGGIFSEGIDLKNDALIGAIIIGTGLPMVCAERNLLKRCYDDMGLDGFAYAYRYPGMNKVLQAAGRVIRTEEDMGVVA